MERDKYSRVMSKLNTVDIPYDAIQKKVFGYNSEGYMMGFLIQALNEILFEEGWSWETELHVLDKDDKGNDLKYKFIRNDDGGKPTAIVYLTFRIKDEEKNVVFSSSSFGGCMYIGNSLGDTLKGASTDALKKALSYTGVGGTAFRGEIDDQIREFLFFRKEVLARVKAHLINKYKMEEEKTTERALCAFISKLLRKEYSEIEEISEKDFQRINNLFDKLEPEVKSEQSSRSGKNQTKTTKTKTNKPDETDTEDAS